MSDNGSLTTNRDDRVAEVLDVYLEARKTGAPPDLDEFLARYPDLADDLKECLASLAFIRQAEVSANRSADEGLPSTNDLGGILGDFRIVREVGKGGMGIVYEAEQISLRRRVALKVLPFAATLDARHLQRFHNEAQAAACLHHTNIVPVFSVGSERGVHFYAMQYIDGQPLNELIHQMRQREKKMPTVARGELTAAYPTPADAAASTPLPAAEMTPLTGAGGRGRDYFRKVAELGVQAAEGLDHAHQLGIVHRDIKPANLLLDGRGNLWVTDFGLAHMQHGEGSLTLTGQAVGTPRYMSPEQALAKRVPIDHRTDVYSLGVTLYELLTLRPAFASEDRQELLRQIAFDDPSSPRRMERAIPAELEIIVLKAMEKRPQDRYATAQELADDLRRFLEHRPITARRPTLWQRVGKMLRRHRAVTTAAGVGLFAAMVVLAISTVWVTIKNGEKDSALREKETALEEARLNLEELIRQRKDVRDALKIATDQMPSAKNLLDTYLRNGGSRSFARDLATKLAEAWEKIVKVDPIHSTYWDRLYETQLLVGSLWWQEGNAPQAAEVFAKAVATAEKMGAMNPWNDFVDVSKIDPNMDSRIQLVGALDSLGIAYRYCGRYSDGAAALERAKGVYRTLAERYASEAVAFSRRKKKGAEEMFSVKLKRAEAKTRIALAELLTEAGRLKEAQTALDDTARMVKSIPPNAVRTPLTFQEGKRLLAQAHLDWKAKRRDKAEAEYRAVRTLWEATDEKSIRTLRREFAWLLCTCPVTDVRDPQRAVRLMATAEKMEAELAKDKMEKSTIRKERPGDYWLALGAAHYFAGDAKSAAEALERAYAARNYTTKKIPPGRDLSKSISPRQTPYDCFLFAMAKAKLGDKEQARRWFDRGVAWMEKSRPGCDELRRFRAEAENLLGIEDTSALKNKELLPQKP